MTRIKKRAMTALLLSLAACATPDPYAPQPYRERIEFALMPGDLPFPRAAIDEALLYAAEQVAAATGRDAAVVDVPEPFDPANTRRCYVHFTATGTGRTSLYVPDRFAAVARVRADTCTIWLRSADMVSEGYMRNAILHEAGHTFLPDGYHSSDPRSIMFPRIREGRYTFTERDLRLI